MSKLSIGLAGAGPWGVNLLRTVLRRADCRIAGVCDPSSERLTLASKLEVAPGHSSLESLLRHERCDAVVIATPPQSHAELAERALRAGKHVFVEKPMALSIGEARAMCETAERAGRVLMVGHLLHYHPASSVIARTLGAGTLGELREVVSIRTGTARSDSSLWWRLAPHDLSFLRWLAAGDLSMVWTRSDGLPGFERVRAGLRLKADCFCSLELRNFGPRLRLMSFLGTRGALVFDDHAVSPQIVLYEFVPSARRRFRAFLERWIRRGAAPELGPVYDFRATELAVPSAQPLDREVEHFADCVKTANTPRTDGREGLAVVSLLQEGERLARKERTPAAVTLRDDSASQPGLSS